MREYAGKSRGGCRGPRPGAGFTLIELLVVIAVISLLVGILVPVVAMAVRKAENARAQARVTELGTACYMYYNQDGKEQYYPGQQYPQHLDGTDPHHATHFTGSLCLAFAFFYDENLAAFGSSKYASLESSEEDIPSFPTDRGTGAGSIPGIARGISDRTSRPMAILYFPARLGVANDHYRDQYKYDDNSVYVDTPKLYERYKDEYHPDDDTFKLSGYRTVMRQGEPPAANLEVGFYPRFVLVPGTQNVRNEGKFLIIAAGMDRLYFTPDDLCFPPRGQ